MPECIVPDPLPVCGAKILARRMCRKHYLRWWRYGDPFMIMTGSGGVPGDEMLRFRDLLGPPEETGCRPWLGALKDGYGRFRTATGRIVAAHIFAWELDNGPVPLDPETGIRLHLDHQCHNLAVLAGLCSPGVCGHRRCCNSGHLIVRQPSDHTAGSASGNAKLTEAQIPEIRAALQARETQRSIAARFGVSHCTIGAIARDQAWKHVRVIP